MRITILTYGSRGDLQPYVALARGLLARGHEVRLAASVNFATQVAATGVPYAPLAGDTRAIIESPQGRAWLSAGDAGTFFKELGRIAHGLAAELQRGFLAAAEGAEAIIASRLAQNRAITLAQHLRVPLLFVNSYPIVPTGAFPHFLVTTRRLPAPPLNRLTYTLARRLEWSSQAADENAWRAQLGLPALKGSPMTLAERAGTPVLHTFSEHVVPRPSDWGSEHTVTGWWRLGPDLAAQLGAPAPDAKLRAWVEDGEPPIFLGFGSMPVIDPAAMLRLAAHVARDLGTRVVVGAGWSRLPATADLPEVVRVVDAVDHAWLFPRCSLAVHHGGSGTTGSSLMAGVPTVVCSVFADQPFWGERLVRLGVGAHVPYKRLTRETLQTALQTAREPAVRERTRALGARLAAEDGLTRAIEATEVALSRSPLLAS